MQNGDEALPSIISVGRVILVKMLITFEPHHIFWSKFAYIYIFFENGSEKGQKEEKIHKENRYMYISQAWSRTTVRQAVGLQESHSDHSAATYYTHQRHLYLYS